MMSDIRSQGIKIIYEEIERTTNAEEIQWTYYGRPNTCIYSVGNNSNNLRLFKLWTEKIKNNKMHYFEYIKMNICQVLEEYDGHDCKYCAHNSKRRQDCE